MEFREVVFSFLEKSGMSQAQLARSVGVSTATMSGVVKGTYSGNADIIKEKVLKFIGNYDVQKPKNSDVWVEYENTRFVKFLVSKAITHRKIAIIYGEAGSGKTVTLKRIAENLGNAVFIEIDAATTTRSLLFKITTALKIQGKRSLSDTLDVIVKALENRDVVLFFDECEYLNHKSIELLRRINDFSYTTIIMSGTYDFVDKLKNHRQLASRIRWAWEMKKPSVDAIEKYCSFFNITDKETIMRIYRKAKANFRDIEAIVADAMEIADSNITIDDIESAMQLAFIY